MVIYDLLVFADAGLLVIAQDLYRKTLVDDCVEHPTSSRSRNSCTVWQAAIHLFSDNNRIVLITRLFGGNPLLSGMASMVSRPHTAAWEMPD